MSKFFRLWGERRERVKGIESKQLLQNYFFMFSFILLLFNDGCVCFVFLFICMYMGNNVGVCYFVVINYKNYSFTFNIKNIVLFYYFVVSFLLKI